METIGKAALSLVAGMGSSTPSGKSLVAKPTIRLPETVEECRALKLWAEAQDDRPQPASTPQIAKHLAFMSATLPSKATDDDSGKMRVAVYSRILGDFSNDALAYMARRVCAELDWFPTPRQCLEILRDYREPPTEKDEALSLCHRFWQGRFEDYIAALQAGEMDQEAIDSAPLQWRKIAMERGYLLWIPDEQRYVIRRKVIEA